MDWKLILSTFGAIFLSELGDKTQRAAVTLAASTKQRLRSGWGVHVIHLCDLAHWLGIVVHFLYDDGPTIETDIRTAGTICRPGHSRRCGGR